MSLLALASRALSLYDEAESIYTTIKERLESSKEAETTDDLAELKVLLDRAQAKRKAASADLDAALAALET